MQIHFCCLLIMMFVGLQAGVSLDRDSMEKLGYHGNYNAIVRDLIKNWESPIVYLRQLGYLPSDYEDTSKVKPSLDALMSRMENDDQKNALHAEEEKNQGQLTGIKSDAGSGTSKVKKMKKRKAELPHKKPKQRQRAAVGDQTVNYPTVEQLLAMTQQPKHTSMAGRMNEMLPGADQSDSMKLKQLSQMVNQQRPEQIHKMNIEANNDELQRLVNKIRTATNAKQLEVSGVPGVVSKMPQYSIEEQQSPIGANAILKLIQENPGKSVSELLAKARAQQLTASPKLSTYGTTTKSLPISDLQSSQFSRPDPAQTQVKTHSEIEEPHYLKWDMLNQKLSKISPLDKDFYVDRLVQIFAKKQRVLDVLQNNPVKG